MGETTVNQCILNGCQRSQGNGTWCRVLGIDGMLPVCEEHWKALGSVSAIERTPT